MTSPLHFYYHPTPNPSKVALFLEEAGLPYLLRPVDIARGDQHAPDFEALNPNRKVPVVVDGEIVIFDSSAILLHLARRAGSYLGDVSEHGQAELLSWLMFIASGVGPFTGQAIHFRHYAPPPQPYAARRYEFEAERHWAVLDRRLVSRAYLVGDTYTIVDMALWGWCRGLYYLMGNAAWERFPNVARLFRDIDARPAAERVRQLQARHDFKQGADAETLASLFRHGLTAA
ncbi:glutathione S-transferase [Burkholderia gladioli]|uniref:glutathione S-transferase family protein n=1 Tax=Burkholderia gladioli TaxID=28095 RepID=UPI00075BD2B6|nr:glutathione S-transferase N-terminal domain-containing protein [Burkholderia gladioli]KVM65619.1 glutathione S-transferase [Burkholderia gladioli]